mmetsp:Transcript_7435/g.8415  ORF Transcript_7435/g.8415 Transcript_7435/m.8415 type:complete len:203 (-) Transcript_7435:709-1317(-)
MTVSEAETYFKTYTILLSKVEFEESVLDDEEAKIDNPASIDNVDVRCFALFMFIQLFITSTNGYTVAHNNYTNTAWPGSQGSGGGSAIASPRSKATKVAYTSSESSIILHFVKTNLRLVLKLISSEIHKKEAISLNKNEVDTLRILIRLEEDGNYIPETLSKNCPLFEDQTKVPLEDLYQWISDNLSENEPKSELNIKSLTY